MSEVKASSVTVKLDYAVVLDGVACDALVMRRPKVRDIRSASHVKGTEADQEAVLIGNLCDVPPEVIDDLDFMDYNKLSEALQNFRSPSSVTQI